MQCKHQAAVSELGVFDGWPLAPAFVQRAVRALVEIDDTIDPAEPLRFAIRRAASRIDPSRSTITGLLDFLGNRMPGSARSETRYRWELSHRIGVKMPRYAASERAWTAWRQGAAGPLNRDPFELEARLLLPIVLSENLESLLEASAGGREAAQAAMLLDEASPLARRDLAGYLAMNDPWEDTFALWCMTRAPRVLDHLHSLVVALATTYAAGRRGPVCGFRVPYYGKPLVSASAQLAGALLAVGSDLEVAANLAAFVRDQRRVSGGWGDDADREDPLTTIVAADLLGRTDPSLDVQPTLQYFAGTQDDDGLWRALGPDAPWLSANIAAFAVAMQRPFSDRFRWPHCARSLLDQKTGLPFFAHFIDIANLLANLPGLAAAPIELAFIDLIGFRAFNNRFGQDAGDEVLQLFATELKTVPAARAIRDGGDEFLAIGAPSRRPLFEDLRAFMTAWKARFHARFGADVPAVVPRVVVGRATAADLRALRQHLGREITALKQIAATPETGVLVANSG
jgi:diguanylate cyclase (GGDEF)-like protein